MTSSAPNASNFLSFSSDEEVAITFAPIDFASCSAKIETPPVPCTRTVSPACSLPSLTNARHAVNPAQGNVAASAIVQSFGVRVIDFSDMAIYSVE